MTGWLALLVVGLAGCAEPPRLVVFAAASTVDVVDAVLDGVPLDASVSVASSSVLAHQIAQGAPADVYVTADPGWTDWLIARGISVRRRRVVATGRMVVVGRAAPAVTARQALRGRIAVADPSHVPAGRYARRALQRAKVWDALEPRLIATADVRAALAAVTTGAADRAIVYASEARHAGLPIVWAFPPDEAIRFELAELSAAGAEVFDALAVTPAWAAEGFGPRR